MATPLPGPLRVSVGIKLPGRDPELERLRRKKEDEWVEVIDGLAFTNDGQWFHVAQTATEDLANTVAERLREEREVQAAVRTFGPGEFHVYARRIRLTGGRGTHSL